jgi:hypothetical protein
MEGQALQFTPVIPATHETEIGKLRFEVSLAIKLVRPHLRKQTRHGTHL